MLRLRRLKKSFLPRAGRNPKSRCKNPEHPKMWRGCDVESQICLIWLSDHLGPSPLSHQACAEYDFLRNHVVCSWSGWQPLPEPVFDVPDWLASHSNGMDCLQIVRIHLALYLNDRRATAAQRRQHLARSPAVVVSRAYWARIETLTAADRARYSTCIPLMWPMVISCSEGEAISSSCLIRDSFSQQI